MRHTQSSRRGPLAWLALVALVLNGGCGTLRYFCDPVVPKDAMNCMPRELAKVTMPDYRIEAPDILVIEAIKVVPKAPYRIEPLDSLQIQVLGALPEQPILGAYQVDAGGDLNLGPPYGFVHVLGMTMEEATEAVQKHLQTLLQSVVVSISLGESGARQQIEGEHLVGPDGKVRLGTYGGVFVTGMTLEDAKMAVERHLSQFLEQPEVSLDVYAFNSKVYYIITQGGGEGDSVDRFPITGNETVLDALAQVNGLASVSSKRIWIARPAPHGSCKEQILPVDWNAISAGASTSTNYQIMPGDRLYLAEDNLVALSAFIRKVITPAQQLFGFELLGTSIVRANKTFRLGAGGTSGLGGIGVF